MQNKRRQANELPYINAGIMVQIPVNSTLYALYKKDTLPAFYIGKRKIQIYDRIFSWKRVKSWSYINEIEPEYENIDSTIKV